MLTPVLATNLGNVTAVGYVMLKSTQAEAELSVFFLTDHEMHIHILQHSVNSNLATCNGSEGLVQHDDVTIVVTINWCSL